MGGSEWIQSICHWWGDLFRHQKLCSKETSKASFFLFWCLKHARFFKMICEMSEISDENSCKCIFLWDLWDVCVKTPANVSLFDHLHLEISVLSRDKGDIAIRVRIAPGDPSLSTSIFRQEFTIPMVPSQSLTARPWKIIWLEKLYFPIGFR